MADLAIQNKTAISNVKSLLANVGYKKRFEEILGKKAAGFMSSIVNLTNSETKLTKCDANSVIASAVVAATLDLPIDKNLGFAWIIPYGDKAQFQMGYKGFIQLAMRTGQYKTINATEVYEGDIKHINRLSGEIEFDENNTKQDKIVGYIAYFKLLNGFEKPLYMTAEQMEKHAKKYSQTYKSKYQNTVDSSKWSTDFDSMAIKTVLKLLLSKYGILSIEMQTAIQADQGVIKNDVAEGAEINSESIEYVDNANDADFEEVSKEPVSTKLDDKFNKKVEVNGLSEEEKAEIKRSESEVK